MSPPFHGGSRIEAMLCELGEVCLQLRLLDLLGIDPRQLR
jgi:hypothetical protein